MIDEDREKEAEPPGEPVTDTGRRRRWIVLGVAVLMLAGTVAAGAWWWVQHGGSGAPHGADGQVPAHAGVLTLSQFTVNLADQDVSRFLRATVHLVLDDKDKVEAVAGDELTLTRVRSAVLELLTQQTSDRIVTPEGKTALKQAIAERTSGMLTPVKVTDVLFSDFVVQF